MRDAVVALTAQLQDEGAKAFVQSWHELMGLIGSKSAALAKWELGSGLTIRARM
jgi:hypothetical protein